MNIRELFAILMDPSRLHVMTYSRILGSIMNLTRIGIMGPEMKEIGRSDILLVNLNISFVVVMKQ